MVYSFALLGGILYIVQPELFEAGMDCFNRLKANESVHKEFAMFTEVLELWATPFNALSVICNRASPLHRDAQGDQQWFDLITTVGEYSGAQLILPDVGMQMEYASGTVVAFSGKRLRHEVTPHVGNRICIAQYMRKPVHRRVGVYSDST